jgi:CheY-like chemotaxis protein
VREARDAGDPYQIVIADYHMPGIDGVDARAAVA